MEISAVHETLIPASQCLFGFYKGLCSYDLSNPVSYFSPGEAVGAFGLIFAVYQLRRPGWDVVLRIRSKFQRDLVWYLGGLGLAAVFFSALLSQIPRGALPLPLEYPITFQLVGFLLFVSAPVTLLFLARRIKNLFNPKWASRFYAVLHSELASSRENISVVIDVINLNLENLCLALKSIRPFPRNPNETDDTPPSEEEKYAGLANAVLTVILGDKKVATYVTTGRLDFLFRLFRIMKEHGITDYQTRLGIERLIETLFSNTDSYLYSQLDYRGLSLSANIYEGLFADPYFVSHHSPFRAAPRRIGYDDTTSAFLKVYTEALRHSLKGYWANECPYDMVDELCQAFRMLSEYGEDLATQAAIDKQKNKEVLRRLHEISFFLGHTYIWDYREYLRKGNIPDREKNATKHDDYNHSVNYAYAKAVYELIENLSRIEDDHGSIRTYAMSATTELISVHSPPESDIEAIRKAFTDLIWEKIDGKYAPNSEGFWPVVLRTYLSMVGFKVADDNSSLNQERQRIARFMNEKIKPKILAGERMKSFDGKGELMEDALLPEEFIFDKTDSKFKFKMGGGGLQVLE